MVYPAPLRVAQLTDLHLFADPEKKMMGLATARSFQAVIAHLQQLEPQPDILLLTGDLSQDESPQSYEYLANVLRPLGIPTYWLPGNHDDLLVMERILSQPPIYLNKSVQVGNWHFILLCSNVPGRVDGEVSATSLIWLEKQLKLAGDRHVALVMHHPPLAIGSEWIDRLGLKNADALFAILDRYPQIKLMLCGHVHQSWDTKREQIRYFTTPSTCVQFLPKSIDFAIDPEAFPGYRLLTVYPDGGWETKVERVAFAYPPHLGKD